MPGGEPGYEVIYAGVKNNTRDHRDEATVMNNFETVQEKAVIRFEEEANGYGSNYSTLSALKLGRLAVERKDVQMKADELLRNKSLVDISKIQAHTNLAKRKLKIKVRNSRSQADIPQETVNPTGPSLKYVKNPPVRTQSKLLSQRK